MRDLFGPREREVALGGASTRNRDRRTVPAVTYHDVKKSPRRSVVRVSIV
jgi:hypothetical protein